MFNIRVIVFTRTTVRAVSCLVVPVFICIDLLIVMCFKLKNIYRRLCIVGTEISERAVAVNTLFDAGTCSQCSAFRLHVGHLHQPVVSTAVLHSDTGLRRQQCKHHSSINQ